MDDGNDNNCCIQGEQVIEGGAREVGEEGGRERLNNINYNKMEAERKYTNEGAIVG